MRRRSFLQKGLFGALVLGLGGTGLALLPGKHLATPSVLHVLDDRGFQVLVAVAARVVTAPGASAALIAQGVDEALSRAVPESQADLVTLLALLENALPGLLLDGRTRPFTQLDGPAQDRALEAWRDSRLVVRRSGYHALRRLCLGVYYGDPSAWPSIRYAGPPDLGGYFQDDSKAGTPGWVAGASHDASHDASRDGGAP